LNAHYGIFGNLKVRNDLPAATCYVYAERDPATGVNKLNVSEISAVPAGQEKFKISVDIQYPAGSEKDFPVFMAADSAHGVIYIATKGGILFMYEASTGAKILASRVSKAAILTGAPNYQTKGIFLYNAQGAIIPVDTDAEAMIEFIRTNPGIPNGPQLATQLAIRNGLPGAEQYFVEKFNTFMMNQQYKEAAQVVASSPGTLLRNRETIEKFRALPKQPNQPYPLIQYFFVLLETTDLNDVESLEICAVVLSQNKIQFIQEWISKDKIQFSEALGDLVKPYDMNLAAQIYEKAGSSKAIQAKLASGNINEALSLAGTMGGAIDFIQTIRDTVTSSPEQALAIAKQLTSAGNVQPNKVAEIFMTANRPNELTNYCVECMTQNKPEDAQW
jgi:clathrin heavy chain